MSPRTSILVWRCLLVGGGIVTFAGGVPAMSAQAVSPAAVESGTPNPNTFALSAESDALNVTLTDLSLPTVTTVSAGPYGASASLDSIGESLSNAGAPYSPLAASLPGLVSGLGQGELPPVPPLPGYVSASAPGTPSDSESTGPYSINATASSDDALGTANLGLQQAGSNGFTFFARAETTANSDGSVAVTGSAGADLVNVGGLLDVGNVSSTASLTEDGTGKPTYSSSSKLGTITLLSKPTGVVGQAISVLGVNVPVSLTSALLPEVNQLLSASGIKITSLPETFVYTDGSSSTGTPDSSKTIQSVDSGALEISEQHTVPTQGLLTVSMIIGEVYLSATDAPSSSIPNDGGSLSVTPDTSGEFGGLSGGGLSSTGSNLNLGTVGTTPVGPTSTATGPTAPTPTSPGVISRFIVPAPIGKWLYLVIAGGAMAALGASQLIRLAGVRRRLRRKPS